MIHKLRILGTRAGTFMAAMLVAAAFGSASAQKSVEDFYKGKNIDLIIGYSPGGGYDLYARLVGQYLGKHIPGNPNIVPRNMPGAGSRTAVAWISNVAPKDGSVAGNRRPVALGRAGHGRQSADRHEDRHLEADLYRQSERGQQHDLDVAHLEDKNHRGRDEIRSADGRHRRLARPRNIRAR